MDYVGSSLLVVVATVVAGGLLACLVPDDPFGQGLISWDDLEPDVEIVEAADLAGLPNPAQRTSWTVM